MNKMIVEMNWTFDPSDPWITYEGTILEITEFAKGTILSVESFPFGVYKIHFEVPSKFRLAELIGCIPWNNQTTFFSEGQELNLDSFEGLEEEEESSEV